DVQVKVSVVFPSLLCLLGASDYARAMFVFNHLLRYWRDKGMSILTMLNQIHTLFSEESGEIALSGLADSQPPNYRTDFAATRNYWKMTSKRFAALHSGEDLPRFKKFRVTGMLCRMRV